MCAGVGLNVYRKLKQDREDILELKVKLELFLLLSTTIMVGSDKVN
jgi:hypothetical protein